MVGIFWYFLPTEKRKQNKNALKIATPDNGLRIFYTLQQMNKEILHPEMSGSLYFPLNVILHSEGYQLNQN